MQQCSAGEQVAGGTRCMASQMSQGIDDNWGTSCQVPYDVFRSSFPSSVGISTASSSPLNTRPLPHSGISLALAHRPFCVIGPVQPRRRSWRAIRDNARPKRYFVQGRDKRGGNPAI